MNPTVLHLWCFCCVALLYCWISVDSWRSTVDGFSERTSEWHNHSL